MPLSSIHACLVATIVAGLALVGGEAGASDDVLFGTRDDRMRERGHRIELRFEPGYATMVVRCTVHNASRRPDEAAYALTIPCGAVAAGLRVQGREAGKVRWHDGKLLTAGLASERYQALSSVDPRRSGPPGDLALLAWGSQDELALDMFPVAAGGERTVEYTLDMPVAWIDGRWELELAAMGIEGLPAELTVYAGDRRDRLFVDDRRVAPGHRLRLDDTHTLTLAPHARMDTLLELAAVDTGSGRTFVHWKLALPRVLRPIPRQLRVVIALDVSRSLAVGVDEAQRRAALAYLEHLRGPSLAAKVAIVGFDRRVRPLSAGWVSVDRAIEVLKAATLEAGNGSDVALALREATRLFAATPADAPRRVLVLTDFLTASSRAIAEHEAAAAGTGAIVHLAEVGDERPGLRRDDEHPWAVVAARTQGVVWRATASSTEDAEDRARALALFEEWARPLRIDALQIDLGRAQPEAPAPDSLGEGDRAAEQLLVDGLVGEVVARGRLWNIPYVQTAPRSERLSRRWAALVFGSDLLRELDADEQAHVARSSGAITPLTSFLVVSPGTAASRDGIVRASPDAGGLLGKGGGGGWSSGYNRGRSVGFGGRLDRQAWLEDEIADRWERCEGTGRARLVLETTFEEVVDFSLYIPGTEIAKVAACMCEAIWGLWLPAADFVAPRSRWTVVL